MCKFHTLQRPCNGTAKNSVTINTVSRWLLPPRRGVLFQSPHLRRRRMPLARLPLLTTAPSLWLARVASLPRVAPGARCLPALSIYLSALHTTAALTGWLLDQLCSTVCGSLPVPLSQASHASHHSRPRACQLGVGRHHLQPRAYDLRRHLQRHRTVRSVAPPTVTMHQRGGLPPACGGWESGAGRGRRAALAQG